MSNNRESNNQNVSKVTILNISGKKQDREMLIEHLKCWYEAVDYSKKDLSKCSTRQIIRKISGITCNNFSFYPELIIFQNLNNNIVQYVGDELENMFIDIHLNKYNREIVSQQINDCCKLLRKIILYEQ